MDQVLLFPKHEAYQHTGIPWLGDIPAHWALKKNKYLFSEKKTTVGKQSSDYKLLSLTLKGVIVRDMDNPQGKFPAEFNTYKIVNPNDLIFCLFDIEETPRTVGLAQQHGMITGAYTVIECQPEVSAQYLSYYYLSLDFDKRLKSLYTGLRKVIQRDTFMSIKSPVPPRAEQDRIANFLDQKTAEISQVIAKKQRLIELLSEQKAILINQAVTKGLNPHVPMRDSGVPWLGEIPHHWSIVRSKALFGERKERARKGDKQLTASQKYGVIFQDEFMEREGRRVTQVFLNSEILKHVEEGDFVISMRSFQGGIEYCPYSGATSSAYIPIVPLKHVYTQFFKYLFKSDSYIRALGSTSNLVRDGQALRFENFSLVDLPIVPESEQKRIANFLGQKTQENDDAIAKEKCEIGLLIELKAALINQAVTGKIKI